MEFIQIWQILLRRKWIFLSVFFGFFFLVIILLLLVHKSYEANTKILVNKSMPVSNLYQVMDLKTPSDRSEDYEYETEIALALNKEILRELITVLDLRDRSGDKLKTDDFVKWTIINKFMPQPYVEVEQYEDSEILQISATANDPELAVTIANKLAELYIASEIKTINADYGKMRVFVEQKMKNTQDSYYTLLDEMKNNMLKEGIISISQQTEKLIDKVYTLRDSYDNNEKDILEQRESIKNVKNQLDAREQFRKETKAFSYNDQIKTFKSKIGELLIGLAGKSVDIREQHPDYVQLNNEIEKARELLLKEAHFIQDTESYSIDPIHDSLAKQLVDLSITMEISLLRRTILKKYLDAYTQEMMLIPEKNIKNTKIEDKLSINKGVYQSLQKYLLQIDVAESLKLSDIRIVEPAKTPEEPDFPKPPLILALALFFGTAWSLFIGFFIDYTDLNVKNFDELKRIQSVELLGNIPSHIDLKNKKTVLTLNYLHPIVDSYRSIRNNMLIAEQKPSKPKVLMLTSSFAGEGKTSFAVNYAATLSNEKINTLLVDMQISAPSVHNYFEMENSNGLAELASGAVQTEKQIGKAVNDYLRVIPAGVFGKAWLNKEELVKIQDFLTDLRTHYDMIILDAPAIYPSKDTFSLTKYVDGVIYIVAPSTSPSELIQDNINHLRKFGLDFIGLVTNRFKDTISYQFIHPLKWFKELIDRRHK